MVSVSPSRLLAAAAACLLPFCGWADEIFTLMDPKGDDFGAGHIVYPNRPDFEKGSLDLEFVRADRGDGGTWFRVRFVRKVEDPRGKVTYIGNTPMRKVARHGFYTMNVDIYIDTDRVTGSGRRDTLPGRNVEVATDSAWEKAVVLSPRPEIARKLYLMSLQRDEELLLQAEQARVLAQDLDTLRRQLIAEVDRDFFFPTQIRVKGRDIRFFVPDRFLGGEPSRDWAYTVLVTGADVEQVTKVMDVSSGSASNLVIPVGPGRHFDRFGIIQTGDLRNPPVIDLLAPSVEAQKAFLNDYDIRVNRLAAVSGMSPSGREAATPQGFSDPRIRVASAQPPSGQLPPPQSPPAGQQRTGGMSAPATPPATGATRLSGRESEFETTSRRRTISARLRTLNTLVEDGLIDQTEYQELRRKILSEL